MKGVSARAWNIVCIAGVLGMVLVAYVAITYAPVAHGTEAFSLETLGGQSVSHGLGSGNDYSIRWNSTVFVLLSISSMNCGWGPTWCPPFTVAEGTSGTFPYSNPGANANLELYAFSNETGFVNVTADWNDADG